MNRLSELLKLKDIAFNDCDWDAVKEINAEIAEIKSQKSGKREYTDEDLDLNRWNTQEYIDKNNLEQ